MDNECANYYKLLDVLDYLDTKAVNFHLEKDRILAYDECVEIVAGLVKEMQEKVKPTRKWFCITNEKGLTNETE